MIDRCGICCTTLHLFVISLIVTWSTEQVTTKMEFIHEDVHGTHWSMARLINLSLWYFKYTNIWDYYGHR